MPGPAPEFKRKVGRVDAIDDENMIAMEMQAEEDELARIDQAPKQIDAGQKFDLAAAVGRQVTAPKNPTKIRPPGARFGLERNSAVEKKPAIEIPDEAELLELEIDEEVAEQTPEKWWKKIARGTKELMREKTQSLKTHLNEGAKGMFNAADGLLRVMTGQKGEVMNIAPDDWFTPELIDTSDPSALKILARDLSVYDAGKAVGQALAEVARAVKKTLSTEQDELSEEEAELASLDLSFITQAKVNIKDAGSFIFEKINPLAGYGEMYSYAKQQFESKTDRTERIENQTSQDLKNLDFAKVKQLAAGRFEAVKTETTELTEDTRQATLELGLKAIQAREAWAQECAAFEADYMLTKLEDQLAEERKVEAAAKSKILKQASASKILALEQAINDQELLLGLVEKIDLMAEARDLRAVG